MQFGEYIKACREHFELTQDDLVNLLFQSHETFYGLDTVTLSRWERGITYPNPERKQQFIKTLASIDNSIFPCSNVLPIKETEKEVYEKGIQKFIGKHKRFILNFPTDLIDEKQMQFTHLEESEDTNSHLDLIYSFLKKITKDKIGIDRNLFQQWAEHPSTFCLIASYQNQFFGVIFSIRLLPEVLEKVLNFEMKEEDIQVHDLAKPDEEGCEYPITMIAYTEQAATVLILRYYTHLMKHKKNILALGCLPKFSEGEKLISSFGLTQRQAELPKKSSIHAYQADIGDVLTNPNILNMLFKK